MGTLRHIDHVYRPRLVVEGAGVHLYRAFGYHEVSIFDPFLLFDDFRCHDPQLYRAGFPWHPHRGIITITYVLAGTVEHQDSLGNQGMIQPGELQWMTAGSGIIHQEMPQGDERGRLEGFQLWVNLPGCFKMIQPTYRQISSSDIPVVSPGNDGVMVRVISGSFDHVVGPIRDEHVAITMLDISMPPQRKLIIPTPLGQLASCYGLDGLGLLPTRQRNGQSDFEPVLLSRQLFLMENGEHLEIRTTEHAVRFLFLGGKAISESVAWRGPIVMNSEIELDTAFNEFQRGEFIKHRQKPSP